MWVYKTLEIRQGRGRGEEEGMSNKVGLQNMQWRNSRRKDTAEERPTIWGGRGWALMWVYKTMQGRRGGQK